MNTEFDSDDDVPLLDLMPLAHLPRVDTRSDSGTNLEGVQNDFIDNLSDDSMISDYLDDSDNDPTYMPGACAFKGCKEEIFAACNDCLVLLCYDHFVEDVNSCAEHSHSKKSNHENKRYEQIRKEPVVCVATETTPLVPEMYIVEGEKKEEPQTKKVSVNKQKEAKLKRNTGKEYISPNTKKVVPKKKLGNGCKEISYCQKLGRECHLVTYEKQELIFQDYYKLGELRLQREYIVRHIETTKAHKRSPSSRRGNTHKYFLTVSGKRVNVCQKLFLSTLGISEKVARIALAKLNGTGTLEEERRGGRQSEKIRKRDETWRERINTHIERFPKVESHYCRASTSKEYLHSDLTLPKMYAMFIQEISGDDKPCYSTYSRVFNDKNLGFHRPKKDQCSLCMSFLNGSESEKDDLRMRYTAHIAEKNKVRELKKEHKELAQHDKEVLVATFDLQQVIHLPISKENALFYKRRLANYNLTFYNIADGECECFTWHEGQSKRGSSEIATAVYMALKKYDIEGKKRAYLFCDGCPGQNKNSIIPGMMLYLINNSTNLVELSLKYFESFHGQNEGDSAHSTITTAIKHAGDVFVPSQLIPIFRLARRKRPYSVHPLESEDFFDFKKLSQDLKLLSIRRDSEGNEPVNWTNIMELKVVKENPSTVFYKTSHHDSYKSLVLKRQQADVSKFPLMKLNSGPISIPTAKYEDLVSLCTGPKALVRANDHKAFYISLPH